MEETSPFQDAGLNTQSYAPSSGSRKPRKFLRLLLFLIVVGLLIFGVNRFLASLKSAEKIAVSPTPTSIPTPTDTPSPSPSTSIAPTKEVTKTPTPTKASTSSIDKTTGLDRSTLSIEVQNGSGALGVAGKMSDFLKNLGYNVVTTGNADNFNYQQVTVKVKSSKSSFLSLLKKDVSTDYTIGASSSDLASSSSADAVVIVGK